MTGSKMKDSRKQDARMWDQMTRILESVVANNRLTRLSTIDDPTRKFEYGCQVLEGIDSSSTTLAEIEAWVSDRYDTTRVVLDSNTFWFDREQDRTIFVLRWSS